ncbi:Concanavalin A-like lectin/glucanases superfamily protein [Flavobacterium gillisiae]|uniref:Concanavalin A-like lectin/glucanases superfamily protein n=1 Tax=Flavobacterium gillisiae TaxID=150146 RepID=A0A1H3XB39_9FLAO|nr:LamG-like jellyroll fold domain-containing protein [Flavobacterium gillisiae]SDZ96617.1 Concanavalin A-like lectin/glucanases superfamily protein [Flavobacterium gillisiae]
MEENYFFENTNSQNFTAKPNTITSIKLKNNKQFFIVFLSLFLMLFLGNEMNGQTTYNATAGVGNWSFTVPCDVTSINVQAWGPGGKGGDATGKNKYGSGGGGGGYTTSLLSVTSGQVINLTVGAGNSLTNTTILTLTAGYGTSGGADSGPVGLGGTSSGGTSNPSGSPGSIGTISSSGAGGNCPSGGIGGTGRNINSNGNPGGLPGGGGAGGYRNNDGGSGLNGGDGGDGQVIITYTSAFKAYCSPSFTGRVEPITNVTFAGINNTTSTVVGGSTPANESFCGVANLVQGSSTNAISVRGNTAGNFTNYFRVYIDWDQNGVFGNNTNETYYLGTITNSGGNTITLISNISVPTTALTGNTRMRVLKNFGVDPTSPCGTYSYGQSEDYTVTVAPSSPPTITTLGSTNGCAGTSITINGTNLTGATPANVKIGGTPVSSITSNTGTVLVAVIGAGTTGTVTVTTSGGTATSAATFTVNPSPTANAGSALAAICQGETTAALGGSVGGSATGGIWTDGGVGGTFTNNTGATPGTTTWTPPAAYTGTATLTLTTSGGLCVAATTSKPQIVNSSPTTATTGANQTINAALTSTSLGGNTPVSGTGSWSKISGPGTVTFSPTTSGTATVTVSIYGTYVFRWAISNGSCTSTADITVTYVPLTNGPGGVTADLQLWLRADMLNGTTTVADNTDVNTWNTQARATDAIKPTSVGAPKYRNTASRNINFNSVVEFKNNYASVPQNYTDNDASRQYLKGSSGFYTQDMFVVLIPNVTVTSTLPSMDIFCGDRVPQTDQTDGSGLGYGNYTARFSSEVLTYAIGTTSSGSGYGVSHVSTTASYSTVGIINGSNNSAGTGLNLTFNANDVVTTTNDLADFGNVTNSQFWIGRSEGWDGSLDGRIAEIITLSKRSTDSERSNIQSYLAIKYGITLGVNGTSMNYTNSAGTTIWNATANATYNYDITGIGRDDLSKLNQKQSKSVNTTDDITIGLTSIYSTNTENTNVFDTNKKFLVWGNNNGTLAAQAPVVVNISSAITSPTALTSDVSFISVGRTWKVVETGGDVPTVKVSIPITMLSATLTPPGDYLMFISNTPTFDPTAEYRVMKVNGTNLETNYDFNGTKFITFGYAPEKTFARSIKFNGTTDYLDAGNVLDLNTSFTVSAWVNRANSTNKTILSKRNSDFTTGYDLSINSAGKAEMSWFVGAAKKTITSNVIVPVGIWHNIGVTFDGTTAKIYIDGVNFVSTNLAGIPTATTQSFLIAAADGATPTSFFSGSIDEVRVWKVALTQDQYRYVMNQEILNNNTASNGAIIPNTITKNDISSVPWTNLSAYYPMSTYTYTNAKDISNNNYTAALKNLKTVDIQTAPLPYESRAAGPWQTPTTWLNNTVQDLPNSTSIEDVSKTIDWNIVKTTHDITSNGNKTVLGLYVGVGTNSTLTATSASGLQTDGTKIEVSHYLKLDGKIDLVGRSQLVQKLGSDLDVTSSGSLERDQQGQSNKYNYNYWGSPVGPISTTANNTSYTVGGVLKDGTDPATPKVIIWTSSTDGAATNPITLSNFWINKFDNKPNDYANWTKIFQSGTVEAGKGFTMKGSNAATATQNLVFTGKPNNSTISNAVGADQLILLGNPYPSALDVDQFITDNIASIETSISNPATDGALYFWEHYPSNSSHNLRDYKGGYAIRNLAGGVAPSSVGIDFINTSGTSIRPVPNQYIPVGQGFFIYGKTGTGGTVVFKNNQREFVKEENATSQIMYRNATTKKEFDHWTDNSDTATPKDSYKRIRLGFNYYNQNYHRQVLLAFMDEKANSEINDGYDAYNIDDSRTDMYLLNGEEELAIAGEGFFDTNLSYPIKVKTEEAGTISFNIDALENFDANQKIYIFDKLDNSYHSINLDKYELEISDGTFSDRFELRFHNETGTTLGNKDFTLNDNIKVIVNQKVTVQSPKEPIKNIVVYDLLGRKIDSYEKVNALQFTLNHLNKTTVGLILKITLDDDTIVSKKIIF